MTETALKYYAHGKLLLTGEYLVLKGAKALALPLKLGQSMNVTSGKQQNRIKWEAFTPNSQWFSCEIQFPGFKIIESNDSKKAELLKKIFETIGKLNPEFPFERDFHIQTKLDFNPQWGLGSSSTLIANIASWTNVDAYQLNKLIFKGSGYDIACANADGPIFYRSREKPVPVNLSFPFEDHLFFIYSGTKKNTRHGIEHFLKTKGDISEGIRQIIEISENISRIKKLDEFQLVINEHEKIISGIIDEQSIQDKYFSDFNGVVKSLGAWGGDFFLAASSMNEAATKNYFKRKGLQTIFTWNELILND
ncbi:Mevalonate kinase [Tangfeifania diversioriginum]|uniref:Mevalonate kinase n=1 Tax=Tangfeifania diversioriginum TaxID=1168035 RepID=A0A1M6J5R6_9BACT|nr:GYDIA family GHMP kinase [Tangfeifania diversioriginum]SHJ42055.1 Mevalonate kinase [Tangfeifania diversioriginum]